jgi:hypothetical protein
MHRRAKIPALKKVFRLTSPVGRVYKVNGAAVRKRYAPFVAGGHPLVYSYVPDGEIWLERMKGGRRDERNILAHEMTEILLMRFKDWGYDRAHNEANRVEQLLRKGTPPLAVFKRFLRKRFRRGSPEHRDELAAELTRVYEQY